MRIVSAFTYEYKGEFHSHVVIECTCGNQFGVPQTRRVVQCLSCRFCRYMGTLLKDCAKRPPEGVEEPGLFDVPPEVRNASEVESAAEVHGGGAREEAGGNEDEDGHERVSA
jgi:hypothetical protein